MADNHTPEQRHKNMQAIKGKDTSIEILLRKELWKRGYHYRKNYSKLPGKPDIVFKKYKVAVFCDSEFFHGKDFDTIEKQLLKSNNSEFWINKIKTNMERDKSVNRQLTDMGYTVLRFWGKDIKKNLNLCTDEIANAIGSRR